MTLYWGLSQGRVIHLVRLIVWIEPRCPSLFPSPFVLRHLLLGVRLHLAVNLRVTILAHQDDVVRIEEQPLHLSLCLCRLEWDDVVAGKTRLDVTTIDTRIDALALAHSAQSTVTLPHESLDAWPSLIVEHLVMLRSESLPAHRPDGIL